MLELAKANSNSFSMRLTVKERSKKMLDDYLISHCSPTLAGIKTGSLFSMGKKDTGFVRNEIRELNRKFSSRGLRIIPLTHKDTTLIYAYRPEKLSEDLNKPLARSILSSRGYSCSDPDLCLVRLMRKLKEEGEFPHEIGLFLGYPPKDVLGFLNSSTEGVKCVGCWKVYGDPKEALKTFKKFDECTRAYKDLAKHGSHLDELIVRVC